jgi:hypothetical protein
MEKITIKFNSIQSQADCPEGYKTETTILRSRTEMQKKEDSATGTVKLPCGCEYQDKGWMLTRVNECEYHKRKRATKRPYRPKAECVRP